MICLLSDGHIKITNLFTKFAMPMSDHSNNMEDIQQYLHFGAILTFWESVSSIWLMLKLY